MRCTVVEDTQGWWQVSAVTRTGGWVGMAAGQVQVTDKVSGLEIAPVSLSSAPIHRGSQAILNTSSSKWSSLGRGFRCS